MTIRVGEVVYTDNAMDMEVGVCVHSYHMGSDRHVVLIFKNGLTQEYSADEQKMRLEKVGFIEDLRYYQYEDRGKLADDYRAGVFNQSFDFFD